MREIRDKGLIHNIIWADTGDMYADGLTKGSVPRDALNEVMSGKYFFLAKHWHVYQENDTLHVLGKHIII